MNLSTYKKSFLFISISSILFLFLFVGLYLYTLSQERNDILNSNKDFKKEIESLLESSWQHYENQIDDMSFWDDFVKYVGTKDKKWFDFYIATAIDVYELDLVSVYDLKGNIIHAKTKGSFNGDILPKDLFSKLYDKKYLHFFVNDNGTLYNVYGSTIHPSNDPKKIYSKPAGYFFMALRLDDNYFQKLQKISSSEKCSVVFNNSVISEEKIEFYKDLKDWNDKTIAKFYFAKKNHRDYNTSKIILRIIIIAFLLNFLFSVYFFKKWFFKPLKLITNILEFSGKTEDINELKNINGEFGHIGDLFEENNNQKLNLINAKLDAEKSDKLKSIFLANLSHEIRTPINAINGFSELLINTKTSASEKKEFLNVINKSGKNLVGIIDDLIEMSKIESNLLKPNYSSFDLDTCIKELYESIKVTIDPSKELEFKLVSNPSETKFKIKTDEIKLKQIIINLVNNAVKFTEKGSVTLQYKIDENENNIHFYITDTGIGINKENQNKIFERFKRIESDLSIKVGGLGLGLSITKAYIELLEGTIQLESKIGKGSTFQFTIPLIYDTTSSKKKEKTIKVSLDNLTTKNILIAEDDNINFLLFQKIIQEFNYNIIRAKNGQEAVDLCKQNNNIDLILMDIKMPVLNGFEVIAQVKPLLPNIPIIAQTAYSSDEDKIKIKNAGFTDYISKPLDRLKLFELINKHLNQNIS